MASTDKLHKSSEPSIYYREHPSRKHGVRKDRQWVIVQKIGGKRRVSTLGWCSQGISLGDAINKALEYKNNFRLNKEHPDSLAKPICKQGEDLAAAELAALLEHDRKQHEHLNIEFSEYFTTRYLPLQYDNGKKSASKEEQIFRIHIAPVLGKFTFAEIKPLHIEMVSKKIKDKNLADRTIIYAYSIIRQTWNLAIVDGITSKQHPISQVKKPKLNNKRERFITDEEEDLLLPALKARSSITHDMTIISLDTGARWGELADLIWQDVNLDAQTIRLMDTKSCDNRTIHTTTSRVTAMLHRRNIEATSRYVFPTCDGGRQKQVNVVFKRTVDAIGLNEGIVDARKKVTFHTLRHTFASRLAMAGIPLYTIKTAMGHHSITMTERYAHLMPDTLRTAMTVLEKEPNRAIEPKRQNDTKS